MSESPVPPVPGPQQAEAASTAPRPGAVPTVGRRRRHGGRAVAGGDVGRRAFLAGAGAGIAAAAGLGGQLVTPRASFGVGSESGTLVVLFLRGGMDGLSAVVPGNDPHLLDARPDIAVPGDALLPLDRGFGLHPALAPLHELYSRGQLTAVPAVSTPDISRSHFQAQDCLERGGAADGAVEGWLDRVLARLGDGTPFRSVNIGATLARSLAGDEPALALTTLEAFQLGGWDGVHDQTLAAIWALYAGFDHPLATDVATTLDALGTAERLNAAAYEPAAAYPDDELSRGLRELAHLIKADVGLRVACLDLGGWDHHSGMGGLESGRTQDMLSRLGWGMGAFTSDLGDRLDDVTIVVMTEFGRRVEQNASGGTDHGHGATVLLAGGGLNGNTVHGNWPGLAPEARQQGDVAGANDYRDVLGEVVSRRLGMGLGELGDVFPGHQVRPLGVMA